MKFKKTKFIKKATALTLGVGLVSSSLSTTYLPLPYKVHAATKSNAESILANLTPEQRQALNQLSTNDQTGLFLNSNVKLDRKSGTFQNGGCRFFIEPYMGFSLFSHQILIFSPACLQQIHQPYIFC